MSSNTKIVVLRSKEVVYALVLLFVVALIIAVAISLFMPSQNNTSNNVPATQNMEENTQNPESTENSSTETASLYVPGVYTSTLQLGSTNLELQITVDKEHINSITFANLDESVTTMYPLMEPSLNELSTQIISNQSTENISYSDENRYTSMLLMQAITETLEMAKVSENSNSPDNSLHNKEIN